MNGGNTMDNTPVWEKPRIKRIVELFKGSKILSIKKV